MTKHGERSVRRNNVIRRDRDAAESEYNLERARIKEEVEKRGEREERTGRMRKQESERE